MSKPTSEQIRLEEAERVINRIQDFFEYRTHGMFASEIKTEVERMIEGYTASLVERISNEP